MWLVFYHESMKRTAEKLKQNLGEDAELSSFEWRRFDDGFPNLQIEGSDVHRLESFYGTCLLLSFHSPDVIFEQLCLLHALPHMRARNLHVVLPWYCTATMERVDKLGQVATADSLARMLSCCPQGPTGPATILTYDIHWLQEEFYFRDSVLVELRSAVGLFRDVLQRVRRECPDEEIAIVVDAADKHLRQKFWDYPHVVCDKVRVGEGRIVTVKEGEPAGRHCVIADDLVQSGATLLEFAAQLKARGAAKISCMSTHAVFARGSYRKFLGNELIHKFWITDSVPVTELAVLGQEPFEVLSLAPLIADYLRGAAHT
mmetsp:Transcript_65162/g.210095  ORF Transcript_65162/g.210095 Transcript_65162/m.210095 type:complete len:316 (-) Transcript_65162:38-985(-)